ncbi:hypothetical protein FB451DRAFT_457939 [Mycena latifolia]|nr:hypothetical protein FB451DRAFT_457939 [Mycena latifolia]
MPHHSVERYSWAVVQPSPSHSIKYLGSSLASSTASHLSCGKYLAVILEPSKATAWDAVAYLVQPAHFPLPDTYLPIFPCRIGPRHPLVPEFDWPFGDCVINTGKILVFRAVQVKSEAEAIRLSDESTRRLSAICDSDADKQIKADRARRIAETNAEREADGAPDDVSRWTSFSVKSTYVPATPGQIFPPSDIHARVSYNIKSLVDVRPASQCFEDERNIQRLRARFSRPATERTIVWNINQVLIQNKQKIVIPRGI